MPGNSLTNGLFFPGIFKTQGMVSGEQRLHGRCAADLLLIFGCHEDAMLIMCTISTFQ